MGLPVGLGDAATEEAALPIGFKAYDQQGGEYTYVGASGVAVGAPVKLGSTAPKLENCLVGTGETHVLGIATQEFPTTGFTFGFVGSRGVHPTKVPSGTAGGSQVVGGNGTTKAATGVFSRMGVTLATAENDGSVIDVFWL
jgi:hypothetical protein